MAKIDYALANEHEYWAIYDKQNNTEIEVLKYLDENDEYYKTLNLLKENANINNTVTVFETTFTYKTLEVDSKEDYCNDVYFIFKNCFIINDAKNNSNNNRFVKSIKYLFVNDSIEIDE